jgi:hypothetical protein
MATTIYVIRTKDKHGTTSDIDYEFNKDIAIKRLEFLKRVIQIKPRMRR